MVTMMIWRKERKVEDFLKLIKQNSRNVNCDYLGIEFEFQISHENLYQYRWEGFINQNWIRKKTKIEGTDWMIKYYY